MSTFIPDSQQKYNKVMLRVIGSLAFDLRENRLDGPLLKGKLLVLKRYCNLINRVDLANSISINFDEIIEDTRWFLQTDKWKGPYGMSDTLYEDLKFLGIPKEIFD